MLNRIKGTKQSKIQAACGGSYNQNLTYWSTTSTTPCTINICKCQEEVGCSFCCCCYTQCQQPRAPSISASVKKRWVVFFVVVVREAVIYVLAELVR